MGFLDKLKNLFKGKKECECADNGEKKCCCCDNKAEEENKPKEESKSE